MNDLFLFKTVISPEFVIKAISNDRSRATPEGNRRRINATSASASATLRPPPRLHLCGSQLQYVPQTKNSRAFGLKSEEADRQRKKEKARQKATRMMNYGGEKESGNSS